MTLPDQQNPNRSDAPVAPLPCSVAGPPGADPPRALVDMLHAAADGVRSVWKHFVDLGQVEHLVNRVPSSLIRLLDEVMVKISQESTARAMGRPLVDLPVPEDDSSRQHIAGLMADVLTEANRAMACPADARVERDQAALTMFEKFEPLVASIQIDRLDATELNIVNRNCIGLLARLVPHSHPEFKTQEQDHAYKAAADQITQKTLGIQRDVVWFVIHTGRQFAEILGQNPGLSARRLACDIGWVSSEVRRNRDFYVAIGDLTGTQIDLAIDLAVQHGVIRKELPVDLSELRDFIVARRQHLASCPAAMTQPVAISGSDPRTAARI